MITPYFLNHTSLALLWLVIPLSLWLLLLLVSYAGFSAFPVYAGVFQDSVVGSLGKPVQANGFRDSAKELRVNLSPQHPS